MINLKQNKMTNYLDFQKVLFFQNYAEKIILNGVSNLIFILF